MKQIVCPGCAARFNFDESRITGEGVKLRCSRCKAVFKVSRTSSPGPPVTAAPAPAVPQQLLIIANESPAFCSAIRGMLSVEPFDLGEVVEGEIVAQGRHKKVVHFRKKKEGWTKKRGHRQPYTEVLIKAVKA